MHCKDDIGKVVKSHGDTITSYAEYSKRNFKKCHLTPLGRFSVKTSTIGSIRVKKDATKSAESLTNI